MTSLPLITTTHKIGLQYLQCQQARLQERAAILREAAVSVLSNTMHVRLMVMALPECQLAGLCSACLRMHLVCGLSGRNRTHSKVKVGLLASSVGPLAGA